MQDIDMAAAKPPAANIILFPDHQTDSKPKAREEECELVRDAQHGNQAAIDRLMAEFDLMVLKRARAFRRGDPKREADQTPDDPVTDYIGTLADDEVIAAGRLGLLEAINSFDPSLGYRFSTIARYYIQGRIMDAVKGWAGHGLASDSEADRWLAWHRGATAEQIVEATGCSRKSAEYAVEREYAAKQFCCYFEQEGAWDFDDPQSSVSDAGLAIRNPQPRPDWGGMYDALNPSRSNPQLGFHGSTPTAPDRWSRLVDDLFDGDLEAGERFLASKRQMLPNVSRRLTDDKRVWHPASYRPTGDGSMTTEERSREEVLATRARVEGRCQDQVITLAQVRAMANRASARASEVVEGLRMITLRAQRLQRRAAA